MNKTEVTTDMLAPVLKNNLDMVELVSPQNKIIQC